MLKRIADNRDDKSLAVQFRRRRFAFFRSLLDRLESPIRILDVGGTENYWKTMELETADQVFVTLLNITADTLTLPFVKSMAGDARSINADDNSFDIVFSNSVIEHVGTYQDQARMAAEVQRVGKHYFVQTPNKYFPLEPHFLFPCFQFLPMGIRIWLLRNFNLGWFSRTRDAKEAREIVAGIRLLDKQEFRTLFPSASLYEERILGLTKSFVAYGGWDE